MCSGGKESQLIIIWIMFKSFRKKLDTMPYKNLPNMCVSQRLSNQIMLNDC